MTFSDNFNKWLHEQGQEPVSEEEAQALDEAFEATKQALKDPKAIESFAQGVDELLGLYAAGEDVDVAKLASEAWDRVEEDE